MFGFYETLTNELSNAANFQIERSYEEDAAGMWNNETKSWSGMMGHLTRKEVDIAAVPFTMSKFRLNFVDFTRPLFRSPNKIYFMQPRVYLVPWAAYFRVSIQITPHYLVETGFLSICLIFIRKLVFNSLSKTCTQKAQIIGSFFHVNSSYEKTKKFL